MHVLWCSAFDSDLRLQLLQPEAGRSPLTPLKRPKANVGPRLYAQWNTAGSSPSSVDSVYKVAVGRYREPTFR